MAINYTISYTFSPSTTISSSQVNTNFSDNAAVWQGLEALTKSFAALRVDATPTTTTDVAIKSYVDKINGYRRPVLQYASATVVNIETGINGTSGQAQILFPDGTLRTDSTTTRINCNLAQNAVLSGTAQSGLRTGAVSGAQWLAFYAVKVTDSSTNFVTVADPTAPTQANYATLNSNFGTSGWVYLGTLPSGDNVSGTSIPVFRMAGNTTLFTNDLTTAGNHVSGYRTNNTAGATSLTTTYTGGMAAGNIPVHFTLILWKTTFNGTTTTGSLNDGTTTAIVISRIGNAATDSVIACWYPPFNGINTATSSSVGISQAISGYVDVVLGIGASPLL